MRDLYKIIKPLATAKYEINVHWHSIERTLEHYKNTYGGLDENPDFQRGHVWTLRQQEIDKVKGMLNDKI